MLKQLIITNIILIEKAEISFEQGFNVLSGETGSGKSAIMEALNLLTGAKADSNIVRHGAEKGTIQAAFAIDDLPKVIALLEEGGIEHLNGEYLIIQREIQSAGKSRAFINNQPAHLSLLKLIGEELVEMVGQHANQKLLNAAQHRVIVDLFGKLDKVREQFANSWEEENQLQNQINELIASETKRIRDMETCRKELEELEKASLKIEEEEELFTEFTRLSNAEELAQHASEISQTLSEDEILTTLSRLQKKFEQLVKLDPSLEQEMLAFRQAITEIKELALSLGNYQNRIENNPSKLEQINARLTTIDKIKRKYGPTVEQAIDYWNKSKETLKKLENANTAIESLQSELKLKKEATNKLAAELTAKRQQTAKKLEKALLEQLRPLNMPKANFFVDITHQTRSRNGDDLVEFLFSPNVGEKKIPIKDCASGGELSRLMLALQALLAGKEAISTLVFDEIDANIGGETASVIGEKLREIGQKHQVLCITHFPQVAQFADHHLQIYKQEKQGRTISSVTILDKTAKEQELARMTGKRL